MAEVATAVRDRFEAALLSDERDRIDDLDGGFLSDARATYFVLHRAGDIDVTSFIEELLPRLVTRLHVESERRQVQSRERVRGKVDWSATARARADAGFDPSVFVTRVTERTIDTAENRLLRYLVDRISDALNHVPADIAAGICRVNTSFGEHTTIDAQLRLLKSGLDQLQRNRSMRQISAVHLIDASMLAAAENAKNADYALVAMLFRRWQATVLAPDLSGLVACAQSTWALPPSLEAGNDRWVRLAAYCVGRPRDVRSGHQRGGVRSA